MSFIRCITLTGMLVAAVAVTAQAQTATQTVTYSVAAINTISTSGNPGALAISGTFADATNAATTYSVATNQTGAKITAEIDVATQAGVSLKVALAPPTGGTSAGTLTLGTAAQDAVTGITKVSESGKTITYTLSATPAAGVVASSSRTVTFTVTGGV